MAKEKIINIHFNESELLKRYFSFSSLPNKNRDNIYKIMFVSSTNIKVLKIVLKYLLVVEKIPPKKVEKLIFKWCILISYYYFKQTYLYDISIPEFDEILNSDITVNKLDSLNVSSNEIYACLVNNDRDSKKTNSNIEALCNHLKTYQDKQRKNTEIKNEINSDKINSLLTNDNYFFNGHSGKKYLFSKEFDPINKKSSFDRLISETLADNNDLSLFDFSVKESEIVNISKNYNLFKGSKELGKAVINKSVPVIFGYMVYNMIKNENTDFSKKVKFIPETLFFIFLNQAKCDFSVNAFKYQKNNIIIEKENINKCEFVLNNKQYEFSANGVLEK